MSKIDELEAVIRDIIEPLGFELVDAEYRKEARNWVLRVFIDKEGGITLADCQDLSHRISFFIDANRVIEPAYSLEVSSPGLDRKLKKPADFKRFVNSKVVVKTYDAVDNQRNFKGMLLGADEEKIKIDDVTKGLRELPYGIIAVARLNYD